VERAGYQYDQEKSLAFGDVVSENVVDRGLVIAVGPLQWGADYHDVPPFISCLS
jgi:hypothetical protein